MRRMSVRYCFTPCLLAVALCACSSLTEPGPGAPALQPDPIAAAAPDTAPPPPPAPEPTPPPPAPDPQIGASHILIAYKGAMRAAPTVTRSKAEAEKLANKLLTQAKSGSDFGALAQKYSDDPSAKQAQGSLGKFNQRQMVKPFADAAFALQPGGISSVVETPFGYHIIKRTE